MGFKTEPVFLNIDGLVTVDGNPVKASVEINSLKTNISFNVNINAEKTNGNFSTQLPSGDEYEIVVKVDHFPQQVINLNTLLLKYSQDLNVFADFTSPAYDKRLEELIKSTDAILRRSRLFDHKNFSQQFGDLKKEQLEYKVQIAAYKFYENFNYNNVLGFPKIIRRPENDQVTRFTMGSFETYNEAYSLMKKLQDNKLKDAFVVAVYKEERKVLQQLIDEKILE